MNADQRQSTSVFQRVARKLRRSLLSHTSVVYDPLVRDAINLVYNRFLRREALPAEIESWLSSIGKNISFETFLMAVNGSPEAAAAHKPKPQFVEMSDATFIAYMYEIFLGRGARANELAIWNARIANARYDRAELLQSFFLAHIDAVGKTAGTIERHDPSNVEIMGTGRQLTREKWNARKAELAEETAKLASDSAARPPVVPMPAPYVNASNKIRVSAIASLYKGGRYIEKFMQNIVVQSMGDAFELIIIDANSPENEYETIEKFQKLQKNIVYKRIDYRIGIYDAWNVGAGMARGDYLTNTNMDDLRHPASLQIQAETLDRMPFVDVVYQDFFYTLDAGLNFDEVAAYGFKSDVPVITPLNLLHFNSPHNAPMWRKSLHTDVGPFDTSFKSAGDYDFWMRCMASGKTFFKINTPHVVYYQNPMGVSTNPLMPGVAEGHRLFRNYAKVLQSPYFYGAPGEFVRDVQAVTGGAATYEPRAGLYDIAAAELLNLAASRNN